MTSTLPPDVRDVFERFITCELTTVDVNKQPITWPLTPYYRQGAPTIDVTTGLGYPKKADDTRAHPSVSLLFSDSTGSGVAGPTTVLVRTVWSYCWYTQRLLASVGDDRSRSSVHAGSRSSGCSAGCATPGSSGGS